MPGRGQYLIADPPPIETCPLCGTPFIVKPHHHGVAFKRGTDESVAICGHCVDVVLSVHHANGG